MFSLVFGDDVGGGGVGAAEVGLVGLWLGSECWVSLELFLWGDVIDGCEFGERVGVGEFVVG